MYRTQVIPDLIKY